MGAPYNKHRFLINSVAQHPYRHDVSEFAYNNPASTGTNMTEALDQIYGVLYPNYKPAVATPAALPVGGNTINDYRVVTDDGDGKSAGYQWQQREGDVAAIWYKIYDMDWGFDSVLSGFLNKTQNQYVARWGYDDLDETGAAIAGLYAGQTVYGGASANTNLTLKANSGDGVGADTGYVQVGDNFRPDVDDTLALGTATERFTSSYLSTSSIINTMTISTGSIIDSTGAISFGNENLTTTGTFSAATVTGTSSVVAGTLTLSGGSIIDSSGAISFGDENLSTTGTFGAGAITGTSGAFGTLSLGSGSITDSSGAISFADENLSTTGTLGAGVTTVTQLNVDNLRLDGNDLTSTDVNGNINITPNGTGVIALGKPTTSGNITTTGTLGITGILDIDALRMDGNTLSSTTTDTDINITPNGTGEVVIGKSLFPSADNTLALGAAGSRFTTLNLSTGIHDGTNTITAATLMSLRDVTSGASPGDALFWDGSKFTASAPDSEITHSTLSGLTTGDGGHTQFVMLSGRAGGQSIIGGTAASEVLTLESTSNVTKGTVQTKDNLVPTTNATYSGGWDGTDLGDATHFYRDIYSKGVHKNLRIESYTIATRPANSAQNIGRLIYNTDTKTTELDTGTSWKAAGQSKFLSDVAFDGIVTVKDVDVSSDIGDARQAIWALHDNSNDFERIYCSIKATSVSNVRITTNVPLPVASYRLIGME